MAQFTLEIPGLKLRISERSLVAVRRDVGDGRHLTVHWQPQESGRNAGLYTPHVTYPKSGERRTLGRFTPKHLSVFFEHITSEMVMLCAGASHFTSTEALTQEGWVVLGCDEVVEAAVRELCVPQPNHFRFPDDDEQWIELFDVMLERSIEPSELQVGVDTRQPRYLVRQQDETLEGAMLCHFPDDFFGPPGWYILKQKDLTDQIFRVTFMRHASPQLVRALLTLSRFFGEEPAPELIELARSRHIL